MSKCRILALLRTLQLETLMDFTNLGLIDLVALSDSIASSFEITLSYN